MWIQIHIYIYIYIYICLCIYICICILYIHIYIRIYIHIPVYICRMVFQRISWRSNPIVKITSHSVFSVLCAAVCCSVLQSEIAANTPSSARNSTRERQSKSTRTKTNITKTSAQVKQRTENLNRVLFFCHELTQWLLTSITGTSTRIKQRARNLDGVVCHELDR